MLGNFSLLTNMKTTPFIKRILASAFAAMTFVTLATASLNQSALADFTVTYDDASTEVVESVNNVGETISSVTGSYEADDSPVLMEVVEYTVGNSWPTDYTTWLEANPEYNTDEYTIDDGGAIAYSATGDVLIIETIVTEEVDGHEVTSTSYSAIFPEADTNTYNVTAAIYNNAAYSYDAWLEANSYDSATYYVNDDGNLAYTDTDEVVTGYPDYLIEEQGLSADQYEVNDEGYIVNSETGGYAFSTSMLVDSGLNPDDYKLNDDGSIENIETGALLYYDSQTWQLTEDDTSGALYQTSAIYVGDEQPLSAESELETAGVIDTIENVTITMNTEGDSQTAIYNASASTIDTISNVVIEVTSSGEYADAVGINSTSFSSTLGDISDTSIKVTSADGSASGIVVDGGTLSSATNLTIVAEGAESAVGIMYFNQVESDATLDFSGNIRATGTGDAEYAWGVEFEAETATLNFVGDTSISASGGEISAALVSLYSSTLTLKAASSDTKINLSADYSIAAMGAVILDSGNYILSADTMVMAGSLTMNADATLTLSGDTTFSLGDETLTIYVDGDVTAAMLAIAEDATISGLANINVYFVDETAYLDWLADSNIALMDATTAAALSNVTVNAYDVSGTAIDGTYTISSLVGTFDAGTDTETGTSTIPEPSTATLSILALAGLCVRRRRSRQA